jgi:Secretion system C-terminal sorting domain
VQSNCELVTQTPEICSAGQPLTWNLNSQAIKVYQVKGDATGTKTFNLNNWQTGTGGAWINWSATAGVFSEQIGSAINCTANLLNVDSQDVYKIFPNPTSHKATILFKTEIDVNLRFEMINQLGQKIEIQSNQINNSEIELNLNNLKQGIYVLKATSLSSVFYNTIIIN